MTQQELYDLALKRGIKEPAVLQLGDRFVLGVWVSLSEVHDNVLFKSATKGIRIIVEVTSTAADGWDALHKAWTTVRLRVVT